jgi:hypothetical protein
MDLDPDDGDGFDPSGHGHRPTSLALPLPSLHPPIESKLPLPSATHVESRRRAREYGDDVNDDMADPRAKRNDMQCQYCEKLFHDSQGIPYADDIGCPFCGVLVRHMELRKLGRAHIDGSDVIPWEAWPMDPFDRLVNRSLLMDMDKAAGGDGFIASNGIIQLRDDAFPGYGHMFDMRSLRETTPMACGRTIRSVQKSAARHSQYRITRIRCRDIIETHAAQWFRLADDERTPPDVRQVIAQCRQAVHDTCAPMLLQLIMEYTTGVGYMYPSDLYDAWTSCVSFASKIKEAAILPQIQTWLARMGQRWVNLVETRIYDRAEGIMQRVQEIQPDTRPVLPNGRRIRRETAVQMAINTMQQAIADCQQDIDDAKRAGTSLVVDQAQDILDDAAHKIEDIVSHEWIRDPNA